MYLRPALAQNISRKGKYRLSRFTHIHSIYNIILTETRHVDYWSLFQCKCTVRDSFLTHICIHILVFRFCVRIMNRRMFEEKKASTQTDLDQRLDEMRRQSFTCNLRHNQPRLVSGSQRVGLPAPIVCLIEIRVISQWGRVAIIKFPSETGRPVDHGGPAEAQPPRSCTWGAPVNYRPLSSLTACGGLPIPLCNFQKNHPPDMTQLICELKAVFFPLLTSVCVELISH